MSDNKSITVFAPASVANISCGFDIMGFALENEGDKVTVEINDSADTGIIQIIGKYAEGIPRERNRNTAGVALDSLLKVVGKEGLNVRITIEKNLPPGSGMGSSASSAAASVYAINRLLGNPFTTKELIPFAMEGERLSCGTAHADNVAPSLLGGFVLIRSYDPLDIVTVTPPDGLKCVVIHPHIEVRTSDARRVLRKEFPLNVVTRQSANSAALILGMITGDYNLIGRSMNDLLAEPRRTLLIPGFAEAKKSAIDSGAIGCGISGSGPSVFAFCNDAYNAEKIAGAMQKAFMEAGLDSDKIISSLNAPGAHVVKD